MTKPKPAKPLSAAAENIALTIEVEKLNGQVEQLRFLIALVMKVLDGSALTSANLRETLRLGLSSTGDLKTPEA